MNATAKRSGRWVIAPPMVIPPALGYGATGSAPVIAPDESLYFLVSAEKLNS